MLRSLGNFIHLLIIISWDNPAVVSQLLFLFFNIFCGNFRLGEKPGRTVSNVLIFFTFEVSLKIQNTCEKLVSVLICAMNNFSVGHEPFYCWPWTVLVRAHRFNKRSPVTTVENCIPDKRVEEPPMSMNMILVYKSR